MRRGTCVILATLGLYSAIAIFNISSAWSVNNFLMTGAKAYLTYSTSVSAGAQTGIEECKHQFIWERWNCPESALQLSTHNKLRSATRETSFIHAISSAGVMYILTRNCSMGDFENCGCDSSRSGRVGGRGWVWGGCSDNVEFGERISKLFVDAVETAQDARALMNLHNNEAGDCIAPNDFWSAGYNTPYSAVSLSLTEVAGHCRVKPDTLLEQEKAVKATMKRACKCHGVSGSCSVRSCWLQLADFRDVGNYLKNKYNLAQKLEVDKRKMRAGNSAESHGVTTEPFNIIQAADLVFLEDSPDYCITNTSLGHYGTEGRECLQSGKNLSQWEQQTCKRLCVECGLKIEEERTEIVTSCNCKFHWCCTVKCQQCKQVIAKHYCSTHVGAPSNNSRWRNRGHGR